MIVTAIVIVALTVASVVVFFDVVLHDRYVAWWNRAKGDVNAGLDALYQERDRW